MVETVAAVQLLCIRLAIVKLFICRGLKVYFHSNNDGHSNEGLSPVLNTII
jgi:hypothetical protein